MYNNNKTITMRKIYENVNKKITVFLFFVSSKHPVISPKPIDQEQEPNFVGVIIAVLTSIILLLVAVILLIVARNKRTRRSDVLGTLQHNLHSDVLGVDKRLNSNIKVIIIKLRSRNT